MSEGKVAIVMGSENDWETMSRCDARLRKLGVSTHVEVMSAHRTPSRVDEFAAAAEANGFNVIIAGAGMAAALAGSIAARTTLPVIGVPIASGPLQGVDALLSTVQMPPGVPVATVGIGAAGATNAAILAAQIIGRTDARIAAAVSEDKAYQARNIAAGNRAFQERLRDGGKSSDRTKADQPSKSAATVEQPKAKPRRLRGAMSTTVTHMVPDPEPDAGEAGVDMQALADMAEQMSESEHQALTEFLRKLKEQQQ